MSISTGECIATIPPSIFVLPRHEYDDNSDDDDSHAAWPRRGRQAMHKWRSGVVTVWEHVTYLNSSRHVAISPMARGIRDVLHVTPICMEIDSYSLYWI